MDILSSPKDCVDKVLAKLGNDIRVATPLGAGKPNHLLNELYARAKSDSALSLTIYTALTLELPSGTSDLERRFLEPMVDRVFGNYRNLDYELDRVAGKLPDNVRVIEFYFPAGKFKRNATAQRDYISCNYTHVARDLLHRGVNVVMQQVAWGEVHGEAKISLSCNPDVALDMMHALDDRKDVLFVAQTNGELPFMYGDAIIDPEEFHYVVRNDDLDYRMFGPPKMSIANADYMIGLYASTLIRDGGELQVGIGSLGDAIVYALILRQEQNATYNDVLDRLGILDRCAPVIEAVGDLAPFSEGLFAATEMLVDGFMYLYKAGIIKRKVYDDLALQRLLNEQLISEEVTPKTLALLAERKAIHVHLSAADVAYLVRFGVFKQGVTFADGEVVSSDGSRLRADITDPEAFDALCKHCLGSQLEQGAVIHGGFFLGPQEFYQWLRDMPVAERKLINMRSVTVINQLYGNEAMDRLQLRNARFVNTGMMVTMSGAVVSDGLDDGTVISGVGGQYNFVAMAHALPNARSVLQIRATRSSGGELKSNVIWSYGHTTIPRHLRDIIITEYGIADLRGKTDEEIAQALLNVADSRFQDELLERAKQSGKIREDYEIPAAHRNNTPDEYNAMLAELRGQDLFAPFPFGTDLTDEEIVLGGALRRLKGKMDSRLEALEAAVDAVMHGGDDDDVAPYLARMGLEDPQTLKETAYKRLLTAELRNDPRVTGR